MNLRSLAPRVALVASLLALSSLGHAATTLVSGSFVNDASYYEYSFAQSSLQNFTATTSSAAGGGFLPVLTLYNHTTGLAVVGPPVNTGFGDISIAATLAAGAYDLFLTEFPSESADGTNESSGFSPLFAGDTGAQCGLTNTNFINDITCTPVTSNYSLAITSTPAVSSTPEPSTLALLLAPAAGLVEMARRRRRA